MKNKKANIDESHYKYIHRKYGNILGHPSFERVVNKEKFLAAIRQHHYLTTRS